MLEVITISGTMCFIFFKHAVTVAFVNSKAKLSV